MQRGVFGGWAVSQGLFPPPEAEARSHSPGRKIPSPRASAPATELSGSQRCHLTAGQAFLFFSPFYHPPLNSIPISIILLILWISAARGVHPNEPLLSGSQISAAHPFTPRERGACRRNLMPSDNYPSGQEWCSISGGPPCPGRRCSVHGHLPGRAAPGDCWGLVQAQQGLQFSSNGHQHTALPVLFQKVLVGKRQKGPLQL